MTYHPQTHPHRLAVRLPAGLRGTLADAARLYCVTASVAARAAMLAADPTAIDGAALTAATAPVGGAAHGTVLPVTSLRVCGHIAERVTMLVEAHHVERVVVVRALIADGLRRDWPGQFWRANVGDLWGRV